MLPSPFTMLRRTMLALLAFAAMHGAAQAAPRDDRAALRVMSFNVRLPVPQDGINQWKHRRDIAVRAIARTMPDVIGTQELHKAQGDDIVARLPVYGWVGIDRRGGHDDEFMGLFYRRDRLRLIDFGNFWLSETPEVPASIHWGNINPRMVTWALFESRADGRRFHVLNTHLPYREEDEEARLKGARLIAERIGTIARDGPVVLTGDFNTTPQSAVYAALTESLSDAWTAAPRTEGPEDTFHGFTGKPERRIDWILARGLRAVSARTLTDHRGDVHASDHYPVVADYAWP